MKNEYQITKNLIKSWAKEYHLYGTANIIRFILYIIVGFEGLYLLYLNIIYPVDWLSICFSILLIFLALYGLIFARFVNWLRRYKMMSKTYGVTEWLRTTEFSDKEITITDHNSIMKLRYDNIKKIKEKNNIVFIFFNNNMAIRLYKDAFVDGSWEECKEMIHSIINRQ